MIFSITEDFSLSHACLFFQIARKDINNIILPPKWSKKLIEKGLMGRDRNSGTLPHSLPVKGSN